MTEQTHAGRKPNTITLDDIEALLAQAWFVDVKIGDKTTVVLCTLPNGFEILESSACVDPANYDHEMGVAIAKQRIKGRVWPLLGYELQERLYRQR